MGSINSKNCCLTGALLAALFFTGNLYAQSVPGQLGAEIQTLEQKLTPAASPAERHNALVRLAKLRQLSGNIAEAAANWLDAAAADPQDAVALVSGAYCLAAIGEWEKAASAIRPLLASGWTGPAMLQAWFLDACLRAWSAGDASALASLAAHPDFAPMRPLIYYTLWQTLARNSGAAGVGNAESWKSRLLAEFPQSPESRAAGSGNAKDSPVVSAVQSPLWQLLPGKAAAATAASSPVAAVKPAAPAPVSPAPAVSAASASPAPVAPTVSAPPPSPAPSEAASAVVLQTGLFSKEANARAQSEALRKAGFTALISRKLVNGAEHWVVTVPAGLDQRKTAADLKKAGFDSFPVK
jgi:cell division septation protein DedD